MASKYIKKCSTALIVRKLQIKTTIMYHCTPTEMTVIKTQTLLSVSEDVEKLELQYTINGNVRGHRCCGKQVGVFLKKLNVELPYDLESLLLRVYPRELKTYVHTKTCTQIMISSIVHSLQKWKPPKYPSDEWVNEIRCIHTMEYQP